MNKYMKDTLAGWMRERTTCLVFSAFLFAFAIQAGEVMNPNKLTFPVVGNATYLETAAMAFARADFTLTLLPSGKVLAAGGAANGLATAEIYDPNTGGFTATGG